MPVEVEEVVEVEVVVEVRRSARESWRDGGDWWWDVYNRPVCKYSRQRLKEPSEQAAARGSDRDASLRTTWAAHAHKATIPLPVSASQ